MGLYTSAADSLDETLLPYYQALFPALSLQNTLNSLSC